MIQTGRPGRVRRVSEVTARSAEWLWPKRVPLGALTVIAGEPGLGKSLLTTELAAKLSRGELTGQPEASLFLTAEDSLEYTVVPRLIAAGADVDRIVVPALNQDGIERTLRLPNDVGELDELVTESGAKLIVFDPFVAFLPGTVNSWNDQSVRLALAPLAALADKHRASVLMVVHLNKGRDSDPIRRIGGSVAFPAAARSMLLLTRDPDDRDGVTGARVLAHAKSNLGRLAPSLAYRIEERLAGQGADPEQEGTVPVLVESGISHFSATDLLALNEPEARSKLKEAIALLQAELRDGPKRVSALQAAAKELGISPTTLDRAKQQLSVISVKGGLSHWEWALPETSNDTEKVAE